MDSAYTEEVKNKLLGGGVAVAGPMGSPVACLSAYRPTQYTVHRRDDDDDDDGDDD